jgi:hypothetical protein
MRTTTPGAQYSTVLSVQCSAVPVIFEALHEVAAELITMSCMVRLTRPLNAASER